MVLDNNQQKTIDSDNTQAIRKSIDQNNSMSHEANSFEPYNTFDIKMNNPISVGYKHNFGVINKKNCNNRVSFNEFKQKINIDCFKFELLPSNPIKIKEATFSDIYKVTIPYGNYLGIRYQDDPLVLKIAPFNKWYNEKSFYKECYALKSLSGDGCSSLIFYGIFWGRYTAEYQKSWEEFKGESENMHPSYYTQSQKYGCIFMNYDGIDLESFLFLNSMEIFYFMFHLTRILHRLQNKFKFEHRDLHWGNILIKRKIVTNINKSCIEIENDPFDISENFEPFTITLIDFSLSRFETDDYIVYSDFNNKSTNWIFEGNSTIDYQFDIYREMKNIITDWSKFYPQTNTLWIKYICKKLLDKASLFKNNKLNKFLESCILQIDNNTDFDALIQYISTFYNKN